MGMEYGTPTHHGRLEALACVHLWNSALADWDIEAENRIAGSAAGILSDSFPDHAFCDQCERIVGTEGVLMIRRYVVIGWRDGNHRMILEDHPSDVVGEDYEG